MITIRRSDERGHADHGGLDAWHSFSFAGYRDQNNMGNGSKVLPGQVQFMSAGSGVTHSEFNGSDERVLHLLQMWVLPAANGTTPRYDERTPFESDDDTGFHLAVSPDGREGSIRIGADVYMYVGRLRERDTVVHELAPGRRAWLHVARGAVTVNDVELDSGDGVAMTNETRLQLRPTSRGEFVLFDLS